MAYEKRDMSGSIFANRDKRSEKHADYTGDCLIDGQEYWMNAWKKTTKEGKTFLSFSFKKKQPRAGSDVSHETKSAIIDDDLPF